MHGILYTDLADYKLKERHNLTPEDEANVREFDGEFFLKQFLNYECMCNENLSTLREILIYWYYVSPVYLNHPRAIMDRAAFFILSGQLKLIRIVEPVLSGGTIRDSVPLGMGIGKSSFSDDSEIGAPEKMPTADNKEATCDSCKATHQNQSIEVGSEINTLMREYRDEVTDLSVKTSGGTLSVIRRYRSGTWQWDQLIRVKDDSPGDLKLYKFFNNEPDYVTRGDVVYEKSGSGVYKNQTYTIERKSDTEAFEEEKYTFKDNKGNWIVYNAYGSPVSYGNRTGISGAYIYDYAADIPPSGLADRNGNQVLWFSYDDNDNLIQIHDALARKVRYGYHQGRLIRATDVLGHKTGYEYDNGCLVRKTNALGHVVTISYNALNHPVKVTNPSGTYDFSYYYDEHRKIYYTHIRNPDDTTKKVWYSCKGGTFRVDLNGKTTQKIWEDGPCLVIQDKNGNQTIKEYDANDNLLSVIYPDNSQQTWEYDERLNKMTRHQDQMGRVTTLAYDGAGNLIQKIEAKDTPNQRVFSYTYDGYGNMLTTAVGTMENPNEAVVSFTYDANGNLSSTTDPEGGVTSFTGYDAMGNLLSMTDPSGGKWSYTYDAGGNLLEQTDPMGLTTTYEYDAMGNSVAMITPDEKRTAYEYNTRGNLVTVTDPLGNESRMTYNRAGKLLSQTDACNNVTTHTYDKENRPAANTDPSGNTTRFTYTDQTGYASCTSCPGGLLDTIYFPTFERMFAYDILGRKLSETDVISDSEFKTTGFDYDMAGNLIKKTDALGNNILYSYDELNRLAAITDPAGGITRYNYDTRDNLISLTDANGNTTRFEYDRADRMIREIRPMGQATDYCYDAAGNLIRKTDAENQVTRYSYDALNRLTRITYFEDAADSKPSKTVVFTYDITGNMLTWNDGQFSGSYSYDDLNRKLSETVNYGSFEKTIAYTWTLNGLKDSYTDPSGTVYSYTYTNNQLTGIDRPGTGTISFSKYKWMQPESIQFPGKSKRDVEHDPLMRIRQITATASPETPFLSYTYAHDLMDNITAKSTEHGHYTYAYDALYQLTGTVNPELPDEAFTYDNLGNRLSSADTTDQWSYNRNNELSGYDDVTFSLDENGNTIEKNDNGFITRYQYNIENRLIGVSNDARTMIARYHYDPFGRRLCKDVAGTPTYFMYADEGLIGEYTATGDEIKTYGYKPNSTWGTDPLFMAQGGEMYFYHNDHLGTPQKMTSVSGAVVWSANYSSFGKTEVDPASSIENNLRFPGQYYDGETKQHYNWNRFYEPGTGRYIAADPIGFGGGMNLYAYVRGNPINAIDSKGLCPPNWELDDEGIECWPKDYSPICPYGMTPDVMGVCAYTWTKDPENTIEDEGIFCSKVVRTVAICADTLTVGSVIATVYSGGTATPATATVAATATVISIGNGVVTLLFCGPWPSPSTYSTAAGAIPGPPWWSALTALTDMTLTAFGL